MFCFYWKEFYRKSLGILIGKEFMNLFWWEGKLLKVSFDDKGKLWRQSVTHQGYLSCVQSDFLSKVRIRNSGLEFTVLEQFNQRKVDNSIQPQPNPLKDIHKLTVSSHVVANSSKPVVSWECRQRSKRGGEAASQKLWIVLTLYQTALNRDSEKAVQNTTLWKTNLTTN